MPRAAQLLVEILQLFPELGRPLRDGPRPGGIRQESLGFRVHRLELARGASELRSRAGERLSELRNLTEPVEQRRGHLRELAELRCEAVVLRVSRQGVDRLVDRAGRISGGSRELRYRSAPVAIVARPEAGLLLADVAAGRRDLAGKLLKQLARFSSPIRLLTGVRTSS